jgi:glycogen debranching enzyme
MPDGGPAGCFGLPRWGFASAKSAASFYPDRIEELRPIVESLGRRLASAACIGSISEIFDAEARFTPRGCCAQAWSIAEVLRLLVIIGPALARVGSA